MVSPELTIKYGVPGINPELTGINPDGVPGIKSMCCKFLDPKFPALILKENFKERSRKDLDSTTIAIIMLPSIE